MKVLQQQARMRRKTNEIHLQRGFVQNELLLKSESGGSRTLPLWKTMLTFDNAYQMGGVRVANINIVICEM